MSQAALPGSTGPLWWDSATPATPTGTATPTTPARPAADLPQDADVVVVGGGFTGLWTAYYLLKAQPGREVLVLEAQHVGFGASGRNGGWVSALWPVAADTIDRRHGRTATLAHLAALRDTVDEVGRVDAEEGLGAGFVKGGALVVARTPAQEARARVAAAHAASWDDGTVWLDAAATRERLDVAGARGATFTPNCARVHPRRMVDGLAAAVRRLGGRIVEHAHVARIRDNVVVLADGQRISAANVIVATEGWTGTLSGLSRRVAPVYSLMVATEPIDDERWARIGLAGREVFADHGHVVIYGQRTDDGRIAFGGRGAPYHWGSEIRPEFDEEPTVFAALRTTLRELLPQLDGVAFTHAWGGPLGIARDWHPCGQLGPGDPHRPGRRLRRRRRGREQPGRAHPGRPTARPPVRAHQASLGRAPLTALGARAAALARHQRRPAAGHAGRPRGGGHRSPRPARRAARPAHRALTRLRLGSNARRPRNPVSRGLRARGGVDRCRKVTKVPDHVLSPYRRPFRGKGERM